MFYVLNIIETDLSFFIIQKLHKHLVYSIADMYNVSISWWHLQGVWSCEVALLYQCASHAVNSITNRRSEHVRNFDDELAVFSIHLALVAIIHLRWNDSGWKLVRLDDIRKVIPAESLPIFFSRTDGNVNGNIVGSETVESFIISSFISSTRRRVGRERIYLFDIFPICATSCT